MNKHFKEVSLLVIAAVFFVDQAMAVPVERIGKFANITCKPKLTDTGDPSLEQNVLHFDKIIFKIIGQLKARNINNQTNLNNLPRSTELDIKVADNPRAVADLKAKVLSFLGAESTETYYPSIVITDVEYVAIVCPK